MKKDHIQLTLKRMVQKYIKGKINANEAKFLEVYYEHFDKKEDIVNQLSDIEKQQLKVEMERSIMNRIESSQRTTYFFLEKKFVLTAAAMIICVSILTLLFYNQNFTQNVFIANKIPNQVILPGANNAVLILADGSKIILNDIKDGTILNQGNARVSKNKDGLITYDLSKATTVMLNNDIAYNTVVTPRGGQYQVKLPDGSTVWLNAASSLKFPTAFRGKERNVELDGEAYFEVAKNKAMPFQVTANDMTVKVLGTHFNVMAYKEESYLATTLLEGSVKISNSSDKVLLTPGHQAVLNKGLNSIKVLSVDTEEAVAWKNGYFLFNNENIQSIMRKISRWYNVEVRYQGNMNDRDFTGTISRFENVSEVLKLLELTNDAHFKIEGRRITVMP